MRSEATPSAMMMRIETSVRLFGYPAIALVLFLVASGLGIALVLSALLGDRIVEQSIAFGELTVRVHRETILDAVRMLHDGFGSLTVTIDDQIAERDRVTTRWTATGLHTGWFAGIAPTWREVTISGIDIHRLDGDRLVEMWEQLDLASLLAQLL